MPDKQTFYVNYIDKVKIKVVSEIDVRELFDNFLPDLVSDTYDGKVDYTYNIYGTIPCVEIPRDAKLVETFAASDFYVWKHHNVNYAYTKGNKFAAKHFVKRLLTNIDLYLEKDEAGEIAIKVLREIVLREMFKKGYVPIHSAGFERNGEASIFFGAKNAGKSTSLLLHCKQLGYNPMTNDMSLVKFVGDEVEVCGWFYKISYQTKAESLLVSQAIEEIDNRKVKIFPKQFVEKNGLKWTWKAKLKYFVNVKCNYFSQSYEFKKLAENQKQQFKDNVYDDWGFGDYLGIYNKLPEIDKFFDRVEVYSLTGNVSLMCIENSLKEVLADQYFDEPFEIKKVKLGTGKNYKVKCGDKQYFAKIKFLSDEEHERGIDNISEIDCYKRLIKSNVPIKQYLRTKQGKYVGRGSNYYVSLQEWVDGETMGNFEGEESYLMECIKCLANMNNALEGLELPKTMQQIFSRYDFIIEKTQELLAKLESKPKDEIYDKVKECLEWKVQTLKQISKMQWPDINKFTYCNSHGDFSILQTIKRNGKVFKIIDFESVACVPIIWEIMRSFVLSDIDAKDGVLNKQRLEKYIQTYQTIRPLSQFDLDNKYLIYFSQLLQSNYGFYNYIESNDMSLLEFAFWRIKFSKELLKEITQWR